MYVFFVYICWNILVFVNIIISICWVLNKNKSNYVYIFYKCLFLNLCIVKWCIYVCFLDF